MKQKQKKNQNIFNSYFFKKVEKLIFFKVNFCIGITPYFKNIKAMLISHINICEMQYLKKVLVITFVSISSSH